MPDHGRNISFPDIAAFENQQANRTAIGPQLPTMSYWNSAQSPQKNIFMKLSIKILISSKVQIFLWRKNIGADPPPPLFHHPLLPPSLVKIRFERV